MSKKKNLLVVGSSQGVYGGIEAFMMTIAEAASQWPEFNVKLCFKMVKGAKAEDNLIEMAKKACEDVSVVGRGSIALIKLIGWADVIHAQNSPIDIVYPSVIMRKKLFLTVHNRRMESSGINSYLWKFTMKLAHKRWFNSNFVWNSWEPNEKLKNSTAIPTVCKLPSQQVAFKDRKGFLFVGRWIENKGIEEILKAYATCDFDKKKYPLTILGDGPMRHKVKSLIAQLEITEINLPGFVDDASKEKSIASAKWLLAPAKTKEDLGLTPIEARSVAVPSIVTRDGGLPESGGAHALIAEPGDVKSLANCMVQAEQMDEEEYIFRSEEGKKTLNDFLKPIEFYRKEFNM